MKFELYKIETLTNLHVGSGDTTMDIVDNQVQKDPIEQLPNINSSSLKGAFREHFENLGDSKILIDYIFGPDNDNENNHQSGAYSFLEAQLLTRPVRSNNKPYYSATSPETIKKLLETIEELNIEFDDELKEALEALSNLNPSVGEPLIFDNSQNTILEDLEAANSNHNVDSLKEFLGENLTLFNHKDFKELELPVIARNKLDNGKSVNLWYEEIVPKKSTFFFAIGKPQNIDPNDYEKKIKGFESRFNKDGHQIQIGANKSIGYGICNIQKVSKWVKKE